ncbi:HEAT repeat domain-containing protein [Streptomyces sp. NBC_00285]|uniref:HEAT repeat domain-containing protein n=1 Tax=Streptomyces sp. NBC_00285 TaxID=2975700 RepID=UPI002E2CD292|nr:HEAT repeat domain-containing protein [Streptomyces sp. NBC_00285]
MFTGMDEVDWASLRHAYGSAEDVPGLLRGLASTDPVERETALDGMYGAVHHQGDVYDSTLACVPFLLALVASGQVADRAGIVELVVSIGAESEGPDSGVESVLCTRAQVGVRAGAEVFVRLTGDADPSVRRAAPEALVRFLDEPARVLGLLRERFALEPDDEVLLALTESLGLFVRRHPGHAAEALEVLKARSSAPNRPGVRLTALGQLAVCAPDKLPPDLVEIAVGLLRERSARRPTRRDGADCPHSDTLVGRLRRLRPSDEEGSQLLRTLHRGLGHRIDTRKALLQGQLTSPDAVDRCNAVWMSAGLFGEWRADWAQPIALIGAQLDSEDGRLRDAAVSVLVDLFSLAAPAADDLAALVTSRPDLWVRRWEHGAPTLGDPLKALARSGDPRATPVLSEVLAGRIVPADLGLVIGHLGSAGAPLAPELRRRLEQIPPDSPRIYERAVPLMSALTALGDEGAVPGVLRLLREMPAGLRLRDTVVEPALQALGTFGAAEASEVIPVLRELLETEHAAAAAGALWSVEGDVTAVLPVLIGELTQGPRRQQAAAELLARLGPAAGPALPGLRRMLRTGEPWARVSAASAVWRIGGDEDLAAPVLRAAWTENPSTRRTVTACLAALGPAGAPLHDLLRAELAARRRHLASPSDGHVSHDVLGDEQLLQACGEALAPAGA